MHWFIQVLMCGLLGVKEAQNFYVTFPRVEELCLPEAYYSHFHLD